MKHVLIIIFSIFSTSLFSQNIEYARSIIDTLSSEYFAGRGYVDNGIGKASDFIELEYKKSELKKFGNSFKQNFNISTNTINYVNVSINNKELIPCIDYLVNTMSSSKSGTNKVVELKEENLLTTKILKNFINKTNSNSFILIPPALYENSNNRKMINSIVFSGQLNFAGYILGVSNDLNWHIGMYGDEPLPYPIFYIKGDKEFFSSIKKIKYDVKTNYYKKFEVSNLIGYHEGSLNKDSFLVFIAHYDHIGKMGDVYFPGANDNASGVAMMLDLMNFYKNIENTLPYSVVFIAFAAEEAGLLGSQYFVENPTFPLSNIKFLINLDMIGTGNNGIQIVNGSIYEKQYEIIKNINDSLKLLPQVKKRGEACNSDHCPFYQKGVPSIFIYTLDDEITYYHVPQDNSENTPLTAYEGLFKIIVNFFKQI